MVVFPNLNVANLPEGSELEDNESPERLKICNVPVLHRTHLPWNATIDAGQPSP